MKSKRRDPNEPKWGPKMAALPTDMMRAFVVAWIEGSPSGREGKGYTAAARRAGYSGSDETLKVTAYRLAHDIRIQEAMHEEGMKRLNGLAPAALQAANEILEDSKHKDRAVVIKTVLDRTGFHEVREVKTTHELLTGDQLQKAVVLAERMHIPLEQLIGRAAAEKLKALPVPKVEDAEFVEVGEDEQA